MVEMAGRGKATLVTQDDKYGSVIIPGFKHDIFISYQAADNRAGWVSEFTEYLKNELATIIKDPVRIYFENKDTGEAEVTPNLNTLILVPILSHTYCNHEHQTWKNELVEFRKIASHAEYGLHIKLKSGNIANRILPVVIHELDEEDRLIFENETDGSLRGVEFIYKEPGVNRPLRPDDDISLNINRTTYRNQINKVANAIKEILRSMKQQSKT